MSADLRVDAWTTSPAQPVVARVTDLRTGLHAEASAGSLLAARELAREKLDADLAAWWSAVVNPENVTGMLVLDRDGHGGGTFLGTAFAYRTGRYYLTAAHCVGAHPAEDLTVVTTGLGDRQVARVECHPEADLALLTLTDDIQGVTPIIMIFDEEHLAAPFWAFGFPEDALTGARAPTPRLFVGHYLRFFDRTDSYGTYAAVELGIAAPAGLSGGPVVRLDGGQQTANALVVGNSETATPMRVERVVTKEGRDTKTIEVQTVVNYGVALRLEPFRDWIDSRVPSPEASFAWRKERGDLVGQE